MASTLSNFNILIPDAGTAANPTLAFQNSSKSGFFLKADSTIGVAVGGTEVFNFSPGGGSEVGQLILADGTVAAPSLAFGGASGNTGLYLQAADVMSVSSNGAESLRFSAGTLLGASAAAGDYTIGRTISGGRLILQSNTTATNASIILSDTVGVPNSIIFNTNSGQSGSIDGNAKWIIGTGTPAHAVNGSMSFTVGIIGSATNDSAAAGIVGQELITNLATASAVALTTATAATIITQSMTAGDWDVDGVIVYKPAATTSVTLSAAAISTTTNAVPAIIGQPTTNQVLIQNASAAQVPVTDFCVTIPMMRVSLSATTNVFLVAKATFSVDTLAAYGSIRARRVG